MEHKMTVAQLITKLFKFPQDAEVIIVDVGEDTYGRPNDMRFFETSNTVEIYT